MQLSVSTTPPDPTLAAHFAVAGASASHDTLSGAAATATDAAQPDAFAALLSDATPASSPTAATGPGLGSSLTGPTAAATIANFPSWLAADATTANAIPSGAGSGTSPSVPANRSAEMLAGDASTTMPENETMGGAPVIGHPGRGAISPGKRGHTVKSSVSRTGTTDSTRPHPALTANPVVVPMVIAPGLTLGLPGVGDSNSRSSLDETNVTPESETADENENLPMALTPVSSRKEGKSSASPRWLISGEDDDDIPTAASDTGQKGAGRFQLTPPVALAATTPTAPSETTEAAESAEKQAPGFAAIPAFRRSNSDQGAAAPMLTTANRRAPIQREFVGPEVSSTTTDDVPAAAATSASSLSASMGPVPGASPEVAFQSASELSTEPVVEAIVTSSPIAQEKGRDQASDRAPSLLRFENTIPTRAEIFAAFDGNTVAEKKNALGVTDKTFLSSNVKRVTTRDAGLGIGVAKSMPAMSSATLPDRQTFAAPLERAFDVSGTTASAAAGGMLTAEPAVVAHRAVDAVMTAVERYSSGDRHSVQLQFSVGGADLSVRVELRGDEVRTTFRTDSPELRNALAHEWQAASAGTSEDRDVRIAPPVFSAGNNSNFSSFSGDTSSHQRDAQGRRGEADEIFSAVASRSRAIPAFSSALDVSGPATPRVTAPATAHHLSTLA